MSLTYRKRPVVVEAIRWTGENLHALLDWAGADVVTGPTPDLGHPLLRLYVAANDATLTLQVGEWVIKDASGFYPCNADRFAETYEAI